MVWPSSSSSSASDSRRTVSSSTIRMVFDICLQCTWSDGGCHLRRRGLRELTGDFVIGEVAAGVGGPGVAGGDFGAGAKGAAADALETAGGAAAFEEVQAILEAGHDGVGSVLPNLGELAVLDVAEG